MEGNQLAEPTILNGKVGLSYESNAKEISGWRVSKTPKNAKGTFSDAVQEVIYVYSADKENEPGEDSGKDTPESENKTPDEENGNSSGNNSKQTNTQTKSKNKVACNRRTTYRSTNHGLFGSHHCSVFFRSNFETKKKN